MSNNEYITHSHLRELHGSEFEIVRDEPDIRNWKVIGLQHIEVGIVNDLLFDEVSYQVKYLIVDIYGKQLNLIPRLVMIPMGLVELLPDEKLVVVSGLTVGHLASLPTYEKGKITTVTEHAIRTVFTTAGGVAYPDDYQNSNYIPQPASNDKYYKPKMEVVEKTSFKEEMRDNLKQVREKVQKMENDLENHEKNIR